MIGKIKEFLKPSKRKVAVAILIPYVWDFILYSIVFATSLRESVIGLPTFEKFLISLVAKSHIFLVESIIYYPCACAIAILYDKRLKGLREDKELYRLVKAGLLVFNPLSVHVILKILILYGTLLYYKGLPPTPGLTIVEVYPNSSAMELGLKKGDRIEQIGYVRNEWVGNAYTVVKEVFKENPSISEAREILGYVDLNDPADELYIHLYFGGGSRVGHVSTKPFGIRVRDAQGNEAVL